MSYPPGFESSKKKAEAYVDNVKKTAELLDQAVDKAEKQKGKIEKIWLELNQLFKMLRSWVRGEYKKTPVKTIISIVAGILYFVNPFDLIPDFIIGIGYLDDIAVITFVYNSIKTDIKDFSDWNNETEVRGENS
jgi:uncharacterized membrane protein YkvA (DUF1232 family)